MLESEFLRKLFKEHDKYPAYLRSLDGFPKAHHFYTSELEELVRKKYAEDIRIYEKEFNTTLSIL